MACTRIQAAFKEHHGLQCGFCTPAMMLVGSALIEQNPDPSDEDVRWAISGNICRCTGYMNIVKAIARGGRGRHASRRTPDAKAREDLHGDRKGDPRGRAQRPAQGGRPVHPGRARTSRTSRPGMLHMAILRARSRTRGSTGSTRRGRPPFPACIAVVTGELMAQHNLAWMPTMSGDTQAVLATDKVSSRGRRSPR